MIAKLKAVVLTCCFVTCLSSCFEDTDYELRYTGGYSSFRFGLVADQLLISNSPYGSSYLADPNYISSVLPLQVKLKGDSSNRYDWWLDTMSAYGDHVARYPFVYRLRDGVLSEVSRLGSGYHPGINVMLTEDLVLMTRRAVNGWLDSTTALEVYSLTSDSTLRGSIRLDAPHIAVANATTAYVSEGEKLSVIDLRDPARPSLVKSILTPRISHMTLSDGKLILTTDAGIALFSLVDPNDPQRMALVK